MNIKEQDEFKLVQILNKYFPDILLETLSECANEIMQAGYVQLQADSEGLINKDTQEEIYKQSYDDALKWAEKYEVALSSKNWNPNRPADRERWFNSQHLDWIIKDQIKAQKALCDAEKAEALSANNAKWREKIEERNGFCDLGGGINICITEEQWQSILSQMEGE